MITFQIFPGKIHYISYRLLFIFIILNATHLFGAKTDIIILNNGDKITCEIKELQNGKLRAKTDDMGTVYIEWDKIHSLSARAKFDVELQFGSVYFGSLGPSEDPRKMIVYGDSLNFDLFKAFVVRITQIKEAFWERLDGSINFGFDYTKASEVFRLNMSADAAHRTRERQTRLEFSSVTTEQTEKETTQRHTLNISYTKFLGNRWSWSLDTKAEQNTELGINLRLSVSAGGSRNIIQTNQLHLLLFSGLSITREWLRDKEEQMNLELPIRTNFDNFIYDNPETDINTTFALYPNLTTRGRYRAELDSKIKREIFEDFKITFNLWVSYDNKPASANAAKSDYGVVLSFGYTY